MQPCLCRTLEAGKENDGVVLRALAWRLWLERAGPMPLLLPAPLSFCVSPSGRISCALPSPIPGWEIARVAVWLVWEAFLLPTISPDLLLPAVVK